MITSLNQKISEDVADYKAALVAAPYGDDEEVGRITAEIVNRGHSLLQIHKLAQDDKSHVSELLRLFCLPHGALVLDAGCGVGKVAELMAIERPDLRFILLNVSQAQLEMCPSQFRKIHADFHEIPLPSRSVDAVMFNYSLGHGLLDKAIGEAARALVTGGVLFIYDLTSEDSANLIATLGYKAHPMERVEAAALAAGFRVDFCETLAGTTTEDFMQIMDPAVYAEVFQGARPIACRFTKC